ncbi:MAG: hypothetical protein AB9Q17_02205 [Candidatus Reddybacter sp.]
MRNTLSKEKIDTLAQYKRDVDAWVAKHGAIPLVPVQKVVVESKSLRQRESERFQRECAGVGA